MHTRATLAYPRHRLFRERASRSTGAPSICTQPTSRHNIHTHTHIPSIYLQALPDPLIKALPLNTKLCLLPLRPTLSALSAAEALALRSARGCAFSPIRWNNRTFSPVPPSLRSPARLFLHTRCSSTSFSSRTVIPMHLKQKAVCPSHCLLATIHRQLELGLRPDCLLRGSEPTEPSASTPDWRGGSVRNGRPTYAKTAVTPGIGQQSRVVALSPLFLDPTLVQCPDPRLWPTPPPPWTLLRASHRCSKLQGMFLTFTRLLTKGKGRGSLQRTINRTARRIRKSQCASEPYDCPLAYAYTHTIEETGTTPE